MIVVCLRKLSKIFSLWNRTRKELLFIAVLIVLVLHYAFLNDSLNFRSTERVLNELPVPYMQKPHLIGNANATCEVPKLDPFAKVVAKHERSLVEVICDAENWVRCYNSTCKQNDDIQEKILSVICEFRDIFQNKNKSLTFGPTSLIRSNESYGLRNSDYVKVSCTGINATDGKPVEWSANVMGLRAVTIPPAEKDSINVLIIIFDTLSANGFQRLMPYSWQILKHNLRATMMRGYSTIGDGKASALLPILTGKSDFELLNAMKDNPRVLDSVQFLFRKLKERGYRTAFFEDLPSEGFPDPLAARDQSVDHRFNKSLLEEGANKKRYCIGDTLEVKLMLNMTGQFMNLDGNRFGLTYFADITLDDSSMVQSADDDFAEALLSLERLRKDTLIVVMSDHGPRNKGVRDSWQGKLEERLPLLAVALPHKLMRKRRSAAAALAGNVDVVTTPYDLHATLLDVLGMKDERLKRGLTLLEAIPKNRSCSDAGVEPHWCCCLPWKPVPTTDPMFWRTAEALLQFINSLLTEARPKCASRNLTSIDWVMRQVVPSEESASGNQNTRPSQVHHPSYQIRVVLQPDNAVYEATMLHIEKEDRFLIKARHISRINLGVYDPVCVFDTHPHLKPFCVCKY